MRVLGVVFESNVMRYVLVEVTEQGEELIQSNKILISDTRSKDAVKVFSTALQSVFNGCDVSLVGIKEKPESGVCKYRAGAAALKMEALLLLAAVKAEVKFVSGSKIKSCDMPIERLSKFHVDAFKAAIVASQDYRR